MQTRERGPCRVALARTLQANAQMQQYYDGRKADVAMLRN
jgi:hypothetical protein